MEYLVYFADNGSPKTGLTPALVLAKKSDGTGVTPPPISEVALGWYKSEDFTPTEDLVGYVDGGAGLTNSSDRYPPCVLTPYDNAITFLNAPVSGCATPADLTGMIASGTLAHQVLTEGGDVPYVEGDTKPLTCNAADGWDFSGKRVFFCMKASLDDDDANALINREATLLDSRTAEIIPLASDTAGKQGRYYCEWKQYDADGAGNPRTIQQFRLTVRRRVRDGQ